MKDEKATAAAREDARKARLARALRANIARRKTQAGAHRAGKADQRPPGIEAARDEPEA